MSKKLRTFALRNNSNLDSIEYQVMKSKTNKKNIMKKDEFVDLMRQQGWTAEEVKEMVEVPMCGCVRAGVPDEYGDNPHETGSIPMEYVSGKCWLVVVQGDSMRDYDLHEGDRLLVRTQDVARSGEIVVAHYDGGPTVKTYFEDEDGSKWLTPGNDKYQAMRIDETHECRIFGVVQTIIHEHPLGDPATCIRAVKRAKQSAPTQVSERAIAYALSQIREHIQYKRHWFAVFAVLRDLRVVGGLGEFYRPSVRDHGRGGSRSRRQGPGETQRVELQKARLPMGRERLSCWQWTLSGVSGDSPSLPQEAISVGKGRG